MRRRRRPFEELLGHQLDLFVKDNSGLIDQAECARRDYTDAGRGEAEECYAEYLEVVEEATDALTRLREAYALTLDEGVGGNYRAAFNNAARRRFPTFGLELDDYLGFQD